MLRRSMIDKHRSKHRSKEAGIKELSSEQSALQNNLPIIKTSSNWLA